MTDNSARIHIAASDPAFPAKREAAVAAICAAINTIAAPLGYVRKGSTWSRQTGQGRSAINLHRDRFGWHALINLRFLTPDGDCPQSGDWALTCGGDIRIQNFYLPDECADQNFGELFYLDVHDTPASLDQPMRILRTRALPWLDAHHQGRPSIASYLTKANGLP